MTTSTARQGTRSWEFTSWSGETGASGTVVCRELLAAGHTGRAVGRSGRGAPPGVSDRRRRHRRRADGRDLCRVDTVYRYALPPMATWLSTYVDVTTALITVAGHAGARRVY